MAEKLTAANDGERDLWQVDLSVAEIALFRLMLKQERRKLHAEPIRNAIESSMRALDVARPI